MTTTTTGKPRKPRNKPRQTPARTNAARRDATR